MHTLVTQMRLRRLLRLHAVEVDRIRHGTTNRRLRSAAVRRLLDAAANVRAGWTAEAASGAPRASGASGASGGRSTGGASLAGLQRHVHRSLLAAEAAIGSLEHVGADLDRETAEFREATVPLLFFLRGLEQATDQAVEACLAPEPLEHSA
jgi:hypothetical protein